MPNGRRTESQRPILSHTFLQGILTKYPASRTYWLAFSGGLDSSVLLQLASQLSSHNDSFQFKAIHIHHGLQNEADLWVQHCSETATRLGIPITIRHVSALPRSGQSPEEAARDARYGAFHQLIEPNDTLLTGQHLDDQAETFLLQMARGSGLAGLSSMPERSDFAKGQLVRPLLTVSRETLKQFAEHEELSWIEDTSNQNESYERNFLRNSVLPLLKTRWPSLSASIARSAAHCAEANLIIEEQAEKHLQDLDPNNSKTLPIDRLGAFNPSVQKTIIRLWLKQNGYRMPASKLLDQILQQALGAAIDRNPKIHWPEGEIRRYRNRLYLFRPHSAPKLGDSITWDGKNDLILPEGLGTLGVLRGTQGICAHLWSSGQISIRFQQTGEKIRLPNRSGHHLLRNLYQSTGIPPWIRACMPLIYIDDLLVAVGNQWISADCLSTDQTGVKPTWTGPVWAILDH